MEKNVLPVLFKSSKNYFGFPLKIKIFLVTGSPVKIIHFSVPQRKTE